MEPQPLITSTLSLQFGQQIVILQANPNPIDIRFKIYLDPSKLENKKFNLQQFLKTDIKNNSCVLQIKIKSNDAKGLAQKIQQSPQINQMIKKGYLTSFKAYGQPKSNKLYIIAESQLLQQTLTKLSQLSSKQLEQKKQDIELRIGSHNSPDQIRKIIQEQGRLIGIFDSLAIDIKVHKTKQMLKLVETLLSICTNQQSSSLVQFLSCFSNTNLKINCSSSKVLNQFPAWQSVSKKKMIKNNPYFQNTLNLLKNQAINEAQLYLFGQKLTFTGSFRIHSIVSFLDLIGGLIQQ